MQQYILKSRVRVPQAEGRERTNTQRLECVWSVPRTAETLLLFEESFLQFQDWSGLCMQLPFLVLIFLLCRSVDPCSSIFLLPERQPLTFFVVWVCWYYTSFSFCKMSLFFLFIFERYFCWVRTYRLTVFFCWCF